MFVCLPAQLQLLLYCQCGFEEDTCMWFVLCVFHNVS